MENLKISRVNEEEIAVWRNLQKYGAWKKVISILAKKIEQADLVINQIGADRELEYTKRDLAILQKNAYLDLIEMPERMINQLSGTGQERTEDFDPFDEPEYENEEVE